MFWQTPTLLRMQMFARTIIRDKKLAKGRGENRTETFLSDNCLFADNSESQLVQREFDRLSIPNSPVS